MSDQKLRVLRKRAEKAVSDMPEGKLKIKAFEVLFGYFLSQANYKSIESESGSPELDSEPKDNDGSNSCSGRIKFLKTQGFFKTQRTIADVKEELARQGWHYSQTSLSGKLQALVRLHHLRRIKQKSGTRVVWNYSVP